MVNLDLGGNNIPIDNDSNILGLIDRDSLISAPDAAAHRLPFPMDLEEQVKYLVAYLEHRP